MKKSTITTAFAMTTIFLATFLFISSKNVEPQPVELGKVKWLRAWRKHRQNP